MWFVRLETRGKVRLAGRIVRRSGNGVYDGGFDFRANLGQAGVGNLLDLGRATDFHVYPLAAVHFLSFAANAGGGA